MTTRRQPCRRPARLAVLLLVVGGIPLAVSRPVGAAAADLPRPDVDYVYWQLDVMSSSYLMRYSGFDGPPGDLDPSHGNLPPTVNGWQEFFQHWRDQMQSPAVMGAFASVIRYDDHLFQPSVFGVTPTPYLGDVATVTIPGAACPGETVLIAGHPDSTPVLNTGNGSSYDDTSGVTMGMGELQALVRWWSAHGTWPARTIRVALFDAEEIGLDGSQYYASQLVPKGPQGRPILVANMDQNGLEYPAHPLGSEKTTFGPGFWYTNINATPLRDFRIYRDDGRPGPPPPQFVANMAAIVHFRQALDASVRQAFADLGAKYHFSVPLENPADGGVGVPAYLPQDVDRYSPVQDDTLGRTDQVPFIALGIPGYGVLGAYDSNPQDNPLAFPPTPLTPLGAAGIPQVAGYDTPRDDMPHLNLMAGGPTTAVDVARGSVELRRALELPMTWTLDLVARPEYVGAVPAPSRPIALFEAVPNDPKVGDAVTFDANDSVAPGGGRLRRVWDFGDGTRATGARVTHSFAHPGWYDVTLAVVDASGRTAGYHAEIPVGSPSGPAPHADSCGTVPDSAVASLVEAGGPPPGAAGAGSLGLPGTDGGMAGRGLAAPSLALVAGLGAVAAARRRLPRRRVSVVDAAVAADLRGAPRVPGCVRRRPRRRR